MSYRKCIHIKKREEREITEHLIMEGANRLDIVMFKLSWWMYESFIYRRRRYRF